MGNYDRDITVWLGIERGNPRTEKRFLPSLHVEMPEELIAAVGVCGTSAGRGVIPPEQFETIFATQEIMQLCDICRMKFGDSGCVPPAEFHGSHNLEEVCAK